MPAFVDEAAVPRELICGACGHPWDILQCVACYNCEDVYCAACVEDMFAKDAVCVNKDCGRVVEPARFVQVHRTLRSLADAQVPVKCLNFVYGCDWVGVRSAAKSHETSCQRTKPQNHLFVDSVPEDLVCPICHEAFVDPAQLANCDHIFCEACLKQALSMTADKCPVCSTVSANNAMGKVPKQIRAAVDSLRVKCLNAAKGCIFVGPRKEYTAHVRSCTAPSAAPSSATSDNVTSTAPAAAAATAVAVCTVTALNDIPSVQAGVADEQDVTTMLHIEAPVLATLDERQQGISVSAVIDISGSMQGAKLNLVKQSLEFMVTQLSPKDSFGIITFSSNVAEAFPLQKMDSRAKQEAERIIQSMEATDCTNLSGGLFAGIDQVVGLPFVSRGGPRARPSQKVQPVPNQSTSNVNVAANVAVKKKSKGSFIDSVATFFGAPASSVTSTLKPSDVAKNAAVEKTAPTAVLLFTDGQANEGITDRTQLLNELKGRLAEVPHVVVHTFGFGADHDANLLQGIAEQSQGSYYFIKDQTVLKACFADCLGGLVSVVCTQIKIQMSLVDPGVCQVADVMTKYPSTKSSESSWSISIKDMYSGESRDIPVSLRVRSKAKAVGTASPLLQWTVSYHSTVDEKEHQSTVSSAIAFAAEKFSGAINLLVDEQRNRFLAAKAMELARKAAEEKNFVLAREKLVAANRAIANTASSATAYTAQLQQEVQDMEQACLSETVYASTGAKQLNRAINRQVQQRCNDESEDSGMYQTSWKVSMKKAAK